TPVGPVCSASPSEKVYFFNRGLLPATSWNPQRLVLVSLVRLRICRVQWVVRREVDQSLAAVIATVESGDRIWTSFNSVEYVLAVAERPIGKPRSQLSPGFGKAIGMVEDDEALHPRPLYQQMTLDAGTRRPRIPAIDCR